MVTDEPSVRDACLVASRLPYTDVFVIAREFVGFLWATWTVEERVAQV